MANNNTLHAEAMAISDELYRLTLNELLSELKVTESITKAQSRSRLYTINLQFKPIKEWPVDTKKIRFSRVTSLLEV